METTTANLSSSGVYDDLMGYQSMIRCGIGTEGFLDNKDIRTRQKGLTDVEIQPLKARNAGKLAEKTLHASFL
ncbi:hypothetical protein V5O48_016401 [Marasmius crinis-equi]|uniref:Uncharacterized protein n=1 Tax=Marasmius crinis-equi TaxID=585013 RepID=A0ABR3ERV0_9AGAR